MLQSHWHKVHTCIYSIYNMWYLVHCIITTLQSPHTLRAFVVNWNLIATGHGLKSIISTKYSKLITLSFPKNNLKDNIYAVPSWMPQLLVTTWKSRCQRASAYWFYLLVVISYNSALYQGAVSGQGRYWRQNTILVIKGRSKQTAIC